MDDHVHELGKPGHQLVLHHMGRVVRAEEGRIAVEPEVKVEEDVQAVPPATRTPPAAPPPVTNTPPARP